MHPSGRETYGDSMIIDHWGKVLARMPRGTGCVVADIDRRGAHGCAHEFPGARAPRDLQHMTHELHIERSDRTADPLTIARELILRPGGLDDARLDSALSQVMSSSVDSADLYFQLSREESWALEDGIVKEGSASIEQGVGVRALAGEKTGFAYSDEIVLPALEEASRAARAIAVARPGTRRAGVAAVDAATALSTHRSGRRASRRARRSRGSSASIARRARWIRASSR